MRIVVKVGTSLLTTEDGKLNKKFMKKLVKQVAELQKQGHEVLIVTSGAVAVGGQILRSMPKRTYKNACGKR